MYTKQLNFFNTESIIDIITYNENNIILTLHKTTCYIYIHNSSNQIVLKHKYYTDNEIITSTAIEFPNLFLGFENGSIILINLNNKNSSELLINHTGKILNLLCFKNKLYSSSTDGSIIQFNIKNKKIERIYLDIKETTGNPFSLNISLCEKYLMTIHTNNILQIFFTNSNEYNYINKIKLDYKLDLNKIIENNKIINSYFYGIFIILVFGSTILIFNPNYKINNDFILINRIEMNLNIKNIFYFNGYFKGFNNFLIIFNNKIILIDLYTSIIHKSINYKKNIKLIFLIVNNYYILFNDGSTDIIII